MTDTLRTAIIYIAYLIDPHAYPTGSVLPRLILIIAAAQCALAVLLFVRRARKSAWFGVLALLSVVAVPAGLAMAGTREASILTSLPVWIFGALQLAVALYWLATRHAGHKRRLAHVALFIVFAVPCVSFVAASHLADPSHRTY
jgi:4-amino-4-deoxy-L-arabinose transferase-like glycosyltransferase